MIKKIIVNAIVLLAIVTLQYTNIIQFIAFREVIPDILFILVLMNGIFIDPMFAMIFGTAGGLLFDAIGGGIVGFNGLIYATIGYLTFLPQKRVDIDNTILHILAFIVYFIM
ncbi:MAG: rod shape-determining protein MreD, partial [Spirochaetales bacterium]|nr:rod shape-determining protein MreD [Spirochaetales bacterium]